MAFSWKAVCFLVILVSTISVSGVVFAQSDHVYRNKTVLSVSYVTQNVDSLYDKKITVNGTYAWAYPFPAPANACAEFPVSKLPKSANYDSTYSSFRRAENYLFERTSLFYGPVLELRSANGVYSSLPVTTPFYGEPFTVTGKLEKQYVEYACGINGHPVYIKSAYLLVDPPTTGKFKLENFTSD